MPAWLTTPRFVGMSWNDVQLATGPVTFYGTADTGHPGGDTQLTGDAWDAIEQFRAADLPELVNQRTREDCH